MTTSPPAILEARDLTRTYATAGGPLTVLQSVTFAIPAGATAAIVGPSGSGKTTLLGLCAGLDKPSSGEVWITGQPTAQLNDQALTRLRASAIGFVFQFHHLLVEFTAQENVMLPLLAAKGHADDAMNERAASLLAQVGLTPVAKQMANQLSGGQQQRVAIARALVMQPALVLADEPTGNLDTKTADSVFELLRSVNQTSGTSFIIVTHDPRLAQRCDRIIELVDGRIATDQKFEH